MPVARPRSTSPDVEETPVSNESSVLERRQLIQPLGYFGSDGEFGGGWTGSHFVDAMNWLSRVIHGRSAGRLLRPRRRPAVGNSTLIMTRVPPCIYSRRASAARIHSDSYNPTTNAGVQCCSTRGTP